MIAVEMRNDHRVKAFGFGFGQKLGKNAGTHVEKQFYAAASYEITARSTVFIGIKPVFAKTDNAENNNTS